MAPVADRAKALIAEEPKVDTTGLVTATFGDTWTAKLARGPPDTCAFLVLRININQENEFSIPDIDPRKDFGRRIWRELEFMPHSSAKIMANQTESPEDEIEPPAPKVDPGPGDTFRNFKQSFDVNMNDFIPQIRNRDLSVNPER